MIRASILFIAVAALAGTACKKKEDGGASAEKEPAVKPSAGDETKPAPPKEAPPAAAGPKVFEYPTAQAFNDDYRSVKGAAFMDKFGLDGRFRLSSTVDTVITEQSGATKIALKLDGKKSVTLDFADEGKGIAAKGVKKGDAIKVLCDAGGADDNQIMLLRCVAE
ncbi:MAG TPA: hypothetical protein VIV11_07560 [Kofleriaceae bacterium]